MVDDLDGDLVLRGAWEGAGNGGVDRLPGLLGGVGAETTAIAGSSKRLGIPGDLGRVAWPNLGALERIEPLDDCAL